MTREDKIAKLRKIPIFLSAVKAEINRRALLKAQQRVLREAMKWEPHHSAGWMRYSKDLPLERAVRALRKLEAANAKAK